MSIDLSKYNLRTDLILEDSENDSSIKTVIDNPFFHTKVTEVRMNDNQYGKKKGLYYTIETTAVDSHDHDEILELTEVVTKTIDLILEKNNIDLSKKALIVGLGNKEVTPDALGPNVISDVLVTRHLFLLDEVSDGIRNVSTLTPGVMGQTGMETKDIIFGVIKETKPDFLIVVDALASRNINRLCKSIQITDAGINPGSGIGNNRSEISFETVNIPVIAIGVPTVLDVVSIVSDSMDFILKNIQHEYTSGNPLSLNRMSEKNYDDLPLPNDSVKKEVLGNIGLLSEDEKRNLLYETLGNNYNMFVCPKEIDVCISDLKKIISDGINISLHPAYSRQNFQH